MLNLYRTCILGWALALLPAALVAQLTVVVNSVPSNTPSGASIHIAGTFNNWNPGDATTTLTAQPGGKYAITLNPPVGPVRFKFTRGSWSSVEGNAAGGFQPDHVVTYTGLPQTIETAILSWEDQVVTSPDPGSGSVIILSNNFYIPQLNRTRRIWMYLPPNYAASSKRHPVLYMQDGQNLFDPATSLSGEWEVDESLDELFAEGDQGCIVVGIDNGGLYRIDEYSPWANPLYGGGGQGAAYMSFIVNTLKPYVDANYRTMPDRENTGIMGSSMGGLISMYGLMEYQHVFSKAGVFSPSFWFAGNQPASHILGTGKRNNVKVYFLAGGQEPAYVAQDIQKVTNAMLQAGFDASEMTTHLPADGQHSEWFWRREFADAYQWLFAGSVTSAGEASTDNEPALEVYPNPATEFIRVTDAANEAKPLHVQILGVDGSLQHDAQVQPGEAISVSTLSKGFYVVRVRAEGQNWRTTKMIRQ
ncbi:MAG: T9SS type A sorting domain-containing protein [Lewinellaceae bacterium]|nr:T9SS type A sorting domain-containing protein [Lewinellaceae bacterium]